MHAQCLQYPRLQSEMIEMRVWRTIARDEKNTLNVCMYAGSCTYWTLLAYYMLSCLLQLLFVCAGVLRLGFEKLTFNCFPTIIICVCWCT